MPHFVVFAFLALCGQNIVQGAVPTWNTPASGDATVSIAEAASGASVATASATDAAGGILTYTLVSQTPSTTTYFAVASGGAVTTSATTDYETMTDKSFVLLILATSDTAATDTATGTLTVSITDANDNTPSFAAVSGYTACIASSSSTGTTVTTLTATDNDDTTANNVISAYNIAAGDTSNQFSASTAGVVTVSASLDATVKNIYTLQIEAVDSGGTALTGTTSLIVYLDDDNKCSGAIGLSASLISSFVIFILYQML